MESKKMKRSELLAFFGGLNAVANLEGVKFAYAVVRNKNNCKAEVEALNEAQKPPEDFLKLQGEHRELLEKHCDKDKDGKPVVKVLSPNVTQYAGIAENKAYKKEFDALEKKNKKLMDAREKQMKDYEKLLGEDVTVNLHLIDFETIPEGITPAQLELIFPMMKEEK